MPGEWYNHNMTIRDNPVLFFLSLSILIWCYGCSSTSKKVAIQGQDRVVVRDVIPLTVGNIRGHKMLYEEGWFVVSSSEKALKYAKEKSIISSKIAMEHAEKEFSRHTAEYGSNVENDISESISTGKNALISGKELRKTIFEDTHSIAQEGLAYSQETFRKAVEKFVKGNISLLQRTEEDSDELLNLPGNYFSNLRNDFSNILEITRSINNRFPQEIKRSWEIAFQTAGNEFRTEYEKSVTKGNALTALGPILQGYLKAFYYGVITPVSKNILKTTVSGLSYAVFLPVSAVSVVVGRSIQSVGLTFYYVGNIGVKIISPTVEGGLLSGLSLLSLGSVPAIYTVGGTWGVMNQVAFSTVGPAYAGVTGVGEVIVDTSEYVCFMVYDGAKGTTKVVINQAYSGIVLGYNALSAIPVHLLMGVGDAAVFLAWDGPRLVVVMAQGKLDTGSDDGKRKKYSVGELPVGTVIDLKELSETKGIDVKTISTDESVIEKILKNLPEDLRVGE